MEDLKAKHFTGYCVVTHGKYTYSLVIRNGNTILASALQKHGDEAVGEIQEILEEPVDMILSELTPMQIRLAIEFNDFAQVSMPVISYSRKTSELPGQAPVLPDRLSVQREKGNSPATPGKSLKKGGEEPSPLPIQGTEPVQVSPPDDKGRRERGRTIMIDLDGLDSMDLDSMVEKIRSNARNTVEYLELGHLLVKGGKGA